VSDFLLEIGLEEVPASFLPPIRDQLEEQFRRRLPSSGLAHEAVECFYTLRRLAVHVSGLAPRQEDREEDVTGPPRTAALDAAGRPTKAAAGFARSKGVPVEECRIIVTPKGEYFGFTRTIVGLAASEILPRVCHESLSGLSFPKSMRWGSGECVFVRPVRWVVAVLDGAVLPFEYAGVRAGNMTRIDRFLSTPHQPVVGYEDYRRRLAEAGIVLEAAERRRVIRESLTQEAAAAGGRVREDVELLETVTDLVERPLVICGQFDEEFLELPPEILMTSMREHQKQFALLDPAGRQMPRFLAVADAPGDPANHIRHGNERVLRARLDDARFFWNDDARVTLRERSRQLGRVLFQQGLGSYEDTCARIQKLALHLLSLLPGVGDVPEADLREAALLCKADLTTDMVKEFTSLQGVVGGLYARREGCAEGVWKAVYEHYQPVSMDDPVPSTATGCLLSLADRLDTIAGCFGLGRIPSGSRDPLGLRRLGQGAVRVCVERKWALSLRDALAAALDGYAVPFETPRDEIVRNLMEFVDGRLRFLFEADFGYDLVNAVIDHKDKNPTDMKGRLVALKTFINSGDFLSLATAFKRIKNIIRDQPQGAVSEELFRQEEERELSRAFRSVRAKVLPLIEERAYEPALAEIAQLRVPVDRFFDTVLVMDEDPGVRANRIGLLWDMAVLFHGIADFSQIETEERLRNRSPAQQS